MVFRMELTYSEIENILDNKYIDTSAIGYTLEPSICEINDINLILKSSLPEDVKENVTSDNNRVRSNLTTNKIIRFTKKSFFYVYLS